MKLVVFCTLLTIHLVTNSLAASRPMIKSTELHRSRRSVVIKAMHSIWLSRRRRDVDMNKLVLLRKKLTRMRRNLAVGPTKAIKVEIKFLTSWMDAMSDHTSTPYRMMDGNILDSIFTELIGDTDYIESKVMTLKKSNDKDPQILADIEFDFEQNEEDPLMHLREIVESGRISGMEVSPDYFVIFDNQDSAPSNNTASASGNVSLQDAGAKPTYAPTVLSTPAPTTAVYTGPYQEFQYDLKLKRPWDSRLSDDSNNETKGLEDHVQNIVKIIFDNEPNFVDDKVTSISEGPDEHPFIRIVLRFKPGDYDPKPKILQLVKSGMLGDIPIFEDYLNGELPGSKPPVYNPPQNTEEVRPTKTLVPYQPQDNVQPLAPEPIPSYTTPSPGQILSGHVVLDQTWYPFMDDPKSATDKILSDTIAKAIKEAYKPENVEVKVSGLSRSPDGKIRADFTIIFPENETPTLKPLNDAIATGVLGGLPVIIEKPGAAAPSGQPSQVEQSDNSVQTAQAGQTGQPSTVAPNQATSTQPAVTKAAVTQPAPTQPVATQAAPTQPVVTQAAPTQPVATQAAPSQPVVTQAAPTQPVATQAAPTQPVVTQAAPSQPVVTQAAPTQAKVPKEPMAPAAPASSDVPILPAKPPVVSYNGGIVPLPQGIPSSCEEIRSCGIGNQDGEYVIKARPNCHLSIICQNMNDPHPKEYLGGPAQNQWKYWHYAVLVKLSSHDKEAIDNRACLENTGVGRQFIAKVMAAGARQGNPLVPWKTNIKRMIHSYIGDKKQKKRRSLEDMDVTLSTRAIKIYKRYALL